MPMPPDSVVFWGVLVSHMLVSCIDKTRVLWCFDNSDMCFGATLMDSELWEEEYMGTMTGQWRIVDQGRLTLLRQVEPEFFPAAQQQMPSWMTSKRAAQ